MKKNFLVVLLMVIIIIGAPTILYLVMYKMNIQFLHDGNNSDWVSFWGGYLGAIFGIFGAVFLSNKDRKEQKSQESQFLIVSLYLEKMEKLQEILFNIEILNEELGNRIMDFDYTSVDDQDEMLKIKHDITNYFHLIRIEIVRTKTLYSYFSGNDSYLIEMSQSFSQLVKEGTEIIFSDEINVIELNLILDTFKNKLEIAQDDVTREITLKLIAIQNNYAETKEFLKEEKNE